MEQQLIQQIAQKIKFGTTNYIIKNFASNDSFLPIIN